MVVGDRPEMRGFENGRPHFSPAEPGGGIVLSVKSRSGQKVFFVTLFGFLGSIFLFFAITLVVTDSSDRTSDSLLLSVDRSGPRVNSDEELFVFLAGPAQPSAIVTREAACRNALDWVIDVALNTRLMISSRPDLLRAAELVGEGLVRPEVATAAETEFWSSGTLDRDVDWNALGVSADEANDYVSRRQEPPSPEAAARYVVYATSNTTRRQRVMYVDLDAFSPRSMSLGGNSIPDLEPIVAGVGEVRFDIDECEQFVPAETSK